MMVVHKKNIEVENKYSLSFRLSLLFVFVFVLVVGFSSVYGCLTPTGDDNYINNDTILCYGNYNLNDNGVNLGLFIINSSNLIFNCNNSSITGDDTNIFLNILPSLSNITILNCNFSNYMNGISIESSDIIIKNITISNIGNRGIRFYAESLNNITFNNIDFKDSLYGLDLGISSSNIEMSKLFFSNISNAVSGGNLINISLINSKIINSLFGFLVEGGFNFTIDNLTLENISASGLRFSGVSNSTIKNSNFTNVDISNSTFQAGIVFSIFDGSKLAENNLIYNNYFSNNHIDILISDNQINNSFNITKTLGTNNIIGGEYIGGNFYDDYNGTDNDGDGIGEDGYNISSGLFDYLPLVKSQVIQDNFNTSLESQTIQLGDLFNLTLIIENIVSTSNLNISWGDGNFTLNNSAQSNGTEYVFNYSDFGNYTINTSLIGCKIGEVCIIGTKYISTIWIDVIGYGDGIINGDENCDTNNLGGETCSNYGHNAGSLSCNGGVIVSSACYTQSSSGGGGGSHRKIKKKLEILENKTIINQTKLNITKSISNLTLINQSNLINQTKTIGNSSLLNKSILFNQTKLIINKSFKNLILKNKSILLTYNLSIPIKDNSTKFDFIPYLDSLFDIFEIEFSVEKYNFKPRISLLFKDLNAQIEFVGLKYDFNPKVSLIFKELGDEIDLSE